MALDALRLSTGLLTVFPVRPVADVSRPVAARAMLLAPLAVVPLGLAAGLVFWAAGLARLPGLVAGLLVVGVLALGTRALHLDGLADTVDGLGSGRDTERALTVMRRGDAGPMGVVALVLVLGLQAASLAALPRTASGALAVVLVVCASRAVIAAACRRGVPAARPEGLGALVASSVSPAGWVSLGLVGVALAVLAAVLAGRGWGQGLVAGLLAAAGALTLTRHAVRRLGGITGDVLGAVVETAFTAALVVLAA